VVPQLAVGQVSNAELRHAGERWPLQLLRNGVPAIVGGDEEEGAACGELGAERKVEHTHGKRYQVSQVVPRSGPSLHRTSSGDCSEIVGELAAIALVQAHEAIAHRQVMVPASQLDLAAGDRTEAVDDRRIERYHQGWMK
jgi:hypothetical protein